MTEIILSGSCLVTLVDDADASDLAKYRWRHHQTRGQRTGYAKAHTPDNHNLYLHRLLLSAPAGVQVDHINGDGLDNRRSNLRLCSQSLNNANTVSPRRPASGYRGVSLDPRNGRWVAGIGHRWRQIGRFDSVVDAALAYDESARVAWGSFARLNFPREGELPAFPDEAA